MKSIAINNKTASTLTVEYKETFYKVSVGDKIIIEMDESNNKLHVFQSDISSSKLYLGKFLSKETVRNMCMIGPLLYIAFDLFYELPTGIRKIDIIEKKYHFMLFSIFSLLHVADSKSDTCTYDYHKKSDKSRLYILSAICTLPLAVICFILTVGSMYSLIWDFSFLSVIICLITAALTALLISMSKSINGYIHFDSNFRKVIESSKMAKIISRNNYVINYFEVE
ncbi:MAG: hypothetical protein NC122_03275 [Faecalibacterium sp.]|nr:hypothetical protein [Ruminococcus sp.]MCM1393175.1 hypothetical protein [Ruminococcus sp.]MCM1485208.1 hypothetical protein [Faecalibacterium sp.]